MTNTTEDEKTTEQGVFNALSRVDVEEHVEKKEGNWDKKLGKRKILSYLSWAASVKLVCSMFPDTTWVFEQHPEYYEVGSHICHRMVPYWETKQGFFVSTSVTIKGITKSMNLPILDHKMKPLKSPSTFEINTAHMRCLVKNFAVHGLGWRLYTAEETPEYEGEEKPEKEEKRADPKRQAVMDDILLENNTKGLGFHNITNLIRKLYSKSESRDLTMLQLKEFRDLVQVNSKEDIDSFLGGKLEKLNQLVKEKEVQPEIIEEAGGTD